MITTIPNPVTPGTSTTIIFTNPRLEQVGGEEYILKDTTTETILSSCIGKGPIINAVPGLNLVKPTGFCFDSQGSMYVCEHNGVNGINGSLIGKVRKFNADGNEVFNNTLALVNGEDISSFIQVNLDQDESHSCNLTGIIVDSQDNIYVLNTNDIEGYNVYKYESTGVGGPFILYSNGALPTDIVVDSQGFVYICNVYSRNISKFDVLGNFVCNVADNVNLPTHMKICRDGSDDYLYISCKDDSGNYIIRKFALNGTTEIIPFFFQQNRVGGFTVDATRVFVYILDTVNGDYISQYDTNGVLINEGLIQLTKSESFGVHLRVHNEKLYIASTALSTIQTVLFYNTFTFQNVIFEDVGGSVSIYDSTSNSKVDDFHVDILRPPTPMPTPPAIVPVPDTADIRRRKRILPKKLMKITPATAMEPASATTTQDIYTGIGENVFINSTDLQYDSINGSGLYQAGVPLCVACDSAGYKYVLIQYANNYFHVMVYDAHGKNGGAIISDITLGAQMAIDKKDNTIHIMSLKNSSTWVINKYINYKHGGGMVLEITLGDNSGDDWYNDNQSGSNGIAFDSQSNMYVIYKHNTIRKFDVNGTEIGSPFYVLGPQTPSSADEFLYYIQGITVDNNDTIYFIYTPWKTNGVSNVGNSGIIQLIDTDGNNISSYSTTSFPVGIAVNDGYIYTSNYTFTTITHTTVNTYDFKISKYDLNGNVIVNTWANLGTHEISILNDDMGNFRKNFNLNIVLVDVVLEDNSVDKNLYFPSPDQTSILTAYQTILGGSGAEVFIAGLNSDGFFIDDTPLCVACDSLGNKYVLEVYDSGNGLYNVMKYDAEGKNGQAFITDLYGSQIIGIDKEDNIYITITSDTDPYPWLIHKYNSTTGEQYNDYEISIDYNNDDGFSCMSFDSQSNMYLIYNHNIIKKFDKYGFETGNPFYSSTILVAGITIDKNDTIYYVGYNSVASDSGIIQLVDSTSGDNINSYPVVNSPVGISVDDNGYIYTSNYTTTTITSTYKFQISKYESNGNLITNTWADLGTQTINNNKLIYLTLNIVLFDKKLYFPSPDQTSILYVNAPDPPYIPPATQPHQDKKIIIETYPNPVVAGQKTVISYKNPNIEQTEGDKYYLVDSLGNSVSDEYTGVGPDVNSGFITGLNPDGFFEGSVPLCVACDSQGNKYVIVYDSVNSLFHVMKYDAYGKNGQEIITNLDTALQIAVDKEDNIYIFLYDTYNKWIIHKYNSNGDIDPDYSITFVTDNNGSMGMALDSQSNLYVIDSASNANTIRKFDTTGTEIYSNNTNPFYSNPQNVLIQGITIDVNDTIYYCAWKGNDNSDMGGIHLVNSTYGVDIDSYPTANGDIPVGITVDHNGYIYISNYTAIDNFDGTSTCSFKISKYDFNGNLIINTWTDLGTQVITDTNGPLQFLTLNIVLFGNELYLPSPDQTAIIQAIILDSFTFQNVILYNGLNTFMIYNSTTDTDIASFQIDVPSICFKEGTRILCRITGDQEIYVPIENIQDNAYVKTYKHGYKKVKCVVKSTLYNSCDKTMNKLYKMTKTSENRLTQDLYVTGSHAILYDTITPKKQHKMENLMERFNIDMQYNMRLDGKQKLIAYYDDNFEEYNEEGYFDIYHLVLEPGTNYGVYANGILVESTDEITLSRMKGFSTINTGFQPIDTTFNKGWVFKHIGHIEKKMDEYVKRKAIEDQCVEGIIKKKEFLREREEMEEKKRTVVVVPPKSKSYTYKKTYNQNKRTYKNIRA